MLATCRIVGILLLSSVWARAARRPEQCLLSVSQSRSKVPGPLPEVFMQLDTDGDWTFFGEDNGTASPDNSTAQLRMIRQNAQEVLCPLRKDAARSELSIMSKLHRDAIFMGTPSRCAVVSNSGVLLNHKHGAEIDAADLVIRYNDAVIGGDLQEYVGTKDDIRILNAAFNQKLFDAEPPMELNNHTLYVLQKVYPGKVDGKQTYSTIEREMEARPSLHIYFDSTNLFEWMAKQVIRHSFEGRIPVSKLTTGTMGAFMALSLCDEVHAYGFAETAESASAPFHYFGHLKTGSADKNDIHVSASAEKLLWRTMATNDDVDSTSVAVVPGFRQLNCDSVPDWDQ